MCKEAACRAEQAAQPLACSRQHATPLPSHHTPTPQSRTCTAHALNPTTKQQASKHRRLSAAGPASKAPNHHNPPHHTGDASYLQRGLKGACVARGAGL